MLGKQVQGLCRFRHVGGGEVVRLEPLQILRGTMRGQKRERGIAERAPARAFGVGRERTLADPACV